MFTSETFSHFRQIGVSLETLLREPDSVCPANSGPGGQLCKEPEVSKLKIGGGLSLLLTSLPEIPLNQAIYREVPTHIQIESCYFILDLVSSVSLK